MRYFYRMGLGNVRQRIPKHFFRIFNDLPVFCAIIVSWQTKEEWINMNKTLKWAVALGVTGALVATVGVVSSRGRTDDTSQTIRDRALGYEIILPSKIAGAIERGDVYIEKSQDVTDIGDKASYGTFDLYYNLEGGDDQLLFHLDLVDRELSEEAFAEEVGYGNYLGASDKTFFWVEPTEAVPGAEAHTDEITELLETLPELEFRTL